MATCADCGVEVPALGSDTSRHKHWCPRRDRGQLVGEETLILEATEAICERMEQDPELTRKALAERLGRSKGYVTQVLSGERNMTLRTLAQFAAAFDCRAEVKLTPIPGPPGEKPPCDLCDDTGRMLLSKRYPGADSGFTTPCPCGEKPVESGEGEPHLCFDCGHPVAQHSGQREGTGCRKCDCQRWFVVSPGPAQPVETQGAQPTPTDLGLLQRVKEALEAAAQEREIWAETGTAALLLKTEARALRKFAADLSSNQTDHPHQGGATVASNLPAGVEHSDPHFHEDVDRDCVCGHPRDAHDLAQGHEICAWGWGDPDDPGADACDCEDYQPEEDEHG